MPPYTGGWKNTGFSRFGLLISVRLLVILLTLAMVGYLLATPGYPVGLLLSSILAVLLAIDLFRFVEKTNREVSRFLDAARYADFGQRFEFPELGAGFSELGTTFTSILNRFRQDRNQHEAESRQIKAMIEHVPVPLLSIHGNEQITLWNNAARRLFSTTNITHLKDLEQFGSELPGRFLSLNAGERVLLTLQMDNREQRFSVSMSEIFLQSHSQRLISLQNIQSELDVTQLQAWQDLVRVLTHEIMNSITPVSSLAKTAADLVADVSDKVANNSEIVAELKDVKDAVDTVARRSDGLMDFVSSYRRLTKLPTLKRTQFKIADLFSDVVRMSAASSNENPIAIHTTINPSELDVTADRQMTEQVLINLLQNADVATEDGNNRIIELKARLNQQGHVTIEVLDNGPGIPPDIAKRIFVPFFTTRKEGSGVGLALSRQIMIANGGSIAFSNRKSGGAKFALTF